jgi:hypothetical protein
MIIMMSVFSPVSTNKLYKQLVVHLECTQTLLQG